MLSVGEDGVYVGQAGSPTPSFFTSNASNGFQVDAAEGHGLYVGHADGNGVDVNSAARHGGTFTNNSTDATVHAVQDGSGPLYSGFAGSNLRFSVDNAGNVTADGTFTSPAADLAEAFAVEGAKAEYAPGDVLVISERTDHTVEQSAEAYSSRVVGVYATKPGVLLGEKDADLSDKVPMGVIGVVPTKVSGENGPIRRGDLLVTSSTPGHAMRADLDKLGFGMVLGKALAPFNGSGTGVIDVLVNVK